MRSGGYPQMEEARAQIAQPRSCPATMQTPGRARAGPQGFVSMALRAGFPIWALSDIIPFRQAIISLIMRPETRIIKANRTETVHEGLS